MYKAVFVDIDGTLVDEQKNVSEETLNAIKNAQANGIEIIICTGRQRVEAREFKEMCGLSRYIICTNGSEIYDCENQESLFRSIIDSEECKELYEFAMEHDMLVKLNFGYSRAITNKKYLRSNEILLEEEIDEFLSKNEITQISLCSTDKEISGLAKDFINNSNRIKNINEFIWEVNGEIFYCLHCTNPNASKGNAMAGLCKYLGIDANNVVAIGDDMNDISMLKMAGLGVAMGNAGDDVKKVADMVAETNEESGVGKILQKIVEGGL